MLRYLPNKSDKFTLISKMDSLIQMALLKKITKVTLKSKSLKESQKCLSAKSLLRKEFIKTMKFITVRKNSEERNKKINKDGISSNIKEKTKNRVLQ
jgi:hypothetical protein